MIPVSAQVRFVRLASGNTYTLAPDTVQNKLS
jgi:hypothetical protein